MRLTEQQGDWSAFRSRAVHRFSRTKATRPGIFTQNQNTEDTGNAIRCLYFLFYILRETTFLIGLMLDKRCGVPNNPPRRTSQYQRPTFYNPQSQNGYLRLLESRQIHS